MHFDTVIDARKNVVFSGPPQQVCGWLRDNWRNASRYMVKPNSLEPAISVEVYAELMNAPVRGTEIPAHDSSNEDIRGYLAETLGFKPNQEAALDAGNLIRSDAAVHAAFFILKTTCAVEAIQIVRAIQAMYDNGLEIRVRRE